MHNDKLIHIVEQFGIVLFTLPLIGAVTVGAVVLAAVTLGAAFLLSALSQKKPTVANTNAVPNQQTVDPQANRKFVFGNTAAGNDVRYWEVYSTNGYDQVVVAATHKITSFDAMYVEGNLVSFSGHAATGTFAGGLSFYSCLQGATGANGYGVTVGAGSLYGANGSSTGMATYLLKWNVTQQIFPNGVPTRIVEVIKGCPVYDPRKDGTNGGTGSHRPNDNTTWEYTPTDSNGIAIGRNNALQLLTYLLGWYNTNPSSGTKYLTFGRGVDPNDVDFANWIAAANTCEVEQYYTDFFGTTGDDHGTNEQYLKDGAQGMLLDNGGLWSYYPATDDTASIAVAFDENDIVSGVTWDPKASISQQFNQVGGSFIDPSTTSLYQPQPYPDIEDATYLSQDNGIAKKQNLDFTSVINSTLAQKLARIYLNRSRLTGQFKATFTRKALKAVAWNCVTLTFSPLGWTNKLFRIQTMSINPQGGVDLVLNEENASAYTGGTINTYTSPTAGTAYDPRTSIPLGTLTFTTGSFTGANGTVSSVFAIFWTLPNPGVVAYIELYIAIHGTSNYTLFAKPQYDQAGIFTPAVEPNTGYDILARTVSVNGVVGPFSSLLNITSFNGEAANSVVGQGTGATTNVGTLATLSSVATGNINANAVTNPQNAFTTGVVTATNSPTAVQTIGITTIGGPVKLDLSFEFPGNSNGAALVAISLILQRDGSVNVLNLPTIWFSSGGAVSLGFFNFSIMDAPGAGSHGYQLFIFTGASGYNADVSNRFLGAIELKR